MQITIVTTKLRLMASGRSDIAEREFFVKQDEILFLAAIIVAAGVFFTDSYYQRFDFNSQYLDLSILKVLYQGFKTSLSNLWVLSLFFVHIVIVATFKFYIKKSSFFLYLLFWIASIGILFGVYLVSKREGQKEAYRDMVLNTSKLQHIEHLEYGNQSIFEPNDHYLLFSIDDTFVIVFEALENNKESSYPNFIRIPKSQISTFETSLSDAK